MKIKPEDEQPIAYSPDERIEINDDVRTHLLAAKKEETSAASSWIQLARTGTWRAHAAGAFSFDAETYSDIVKNFSRTLNKEVPLDFEHAAESTEGGVYQKGAPAQGWIKELRFNDNMLEGRVEWVMEQPGVTYVRQKAYKYISPAVMFESVDRTTGHPIGPELVSAALTNRPFLDGMRAVTAKHRVSAGDIDMKTKADVQAREKLLDALKTSKPTEATTAVDTITAPITTLTAEEEPAGQPSGLAAAKTDDGEKQDDVVEPDEVKDGEKKDSNTVNATLAFKADSMMSDDEMKARYMAMKPMAKAQSQLVSHDLRTTTKMSVSLTKIIESIVDELYACFAKWGYSYIVEVFDDHCIFSCNDHLYKVDYTLSGESVSLAQEATIVKRTYTPVEGEAPMKSLMSALGLNENASETVALSAVKGLQVTAKTSVVLLTALGLKDTASDAEASQAISKLSMRAAKADELEPKVVELNAKIAERDKKDAEDDVEFLVKCGHTYGYPEPLQMEKTRKALMAHRISDPTGFADDHKAALDGKRAHDAPHLMKNITAPGGATAAPLSATPQVQAAAAQGNETDKNEAFERKVDEFLARQANEPIKMSRNDARLAVFREVSQSFQ